MPVTQLCPRPSWSFYSWWGFDQGWVKAAASVMCQHFYAPPGRLFLVESRGEEELSLDEIGIRLKGSAEDETKEGFQDDSDARGQGSTCLRMKVPLLGLWHWGSCQSYDRGYWLQFGICGLRTEHPSECGPPEGQWFQ